MLRRNFICYITNSYIPGKEAGCLLLLACQGTKTPAVSNLAAALCYGAEAKPGNKITPSCHWPSWYQPYEKAAWVGSCTEGVALVMFEVLLFKVTVFAEGWIVVASTGGAVTYIEALIVLRLGYYWKGRKMKLRKRVEARNDKQLERNFELSSGFGIVVL